LAWWLAFDQAGVSSLLTSASLTLFVSLCWKPKGFARSYQLQVASDSEFDALVVDKPYLTEARYVLEAVEPHTAYYWRVNATNFGGRGEWSTGSFETVPPMVEVTVPNGGEQWQRGLEYFIQWHDNLSEDVVIELAKGDSLLQVIDTVPSTGAYKWEVGLDIEPGSDYSIKVKSSANEARLPKVPCFVILFFDGWFGGQALFDMSDNTFNIN